MNKKSEAELVRLTAEYVAACEAEEQAEAKKKVLASTLLLLIPRGEAFHGVKHIVEERGTPSWKAIAEKIGRELVPASRRSMIAEIVTANTGQPREYVKRVAEK